MSINPSEVNLTSVDKLAEQEISDSSYFPHTMIGGILKRAKVSSLVSYLKIQQRAFSAGSAAGAQSGATSGASAGASAGKSAGATSGATSAQSYLSSQRGIPGGVATLDTDGRVTASQLRSTGENFKGTYDASTGLPDIMQGIKLVGDYYIVTQPGNRTIGDYDYDLAVGDKLIWNGNSYYQIPNQNPFAPESSQTAFK